MDTPRTPILIALSFCVIVLGVWAIFVSLRKQPVDRRVAMVALSSTGRWLAAGTAQGKITVWNQTSGTAPQQITFSTAPFGELNDLRFSPDEHVLAIASGDLGMYVPEEPTAPRLLRADHENYGSVRFSRDGQNLLVVTGAGVIETLDAHSGALRLKVCCTTIYGEVTFTPDGQAIANAGHRPSLWDARSGTFIGRLITNRPFRTFGPIAFDDRRGAILMGSQNGRVYAWNLGKKQLVAVSPPQSGYVDTLAVSTTGWVIFAGFGGRVELWNPDSGEHRSMIAARPTSNLVLGLDGTSVIFGTANGDVEFWDITTEQRTRALRIPEM